MAIAFVNAADLGNATTNNFTSSAYTVTTGNILWITVNGDRGDQGTGVDDITGVSYGAQTATFVTKEASFTGANTSLNYNYLYCVPNPIAGSHTVNVTSTASHNLGVGVAEYSGAATTGVPDSSNQLVDVAGNTSITLADTTIADECWVIGVQSGYNSNLPPSAGAGATMRLIQPTFGGYCIFDSGAPVTPAGSYAMTINSQGGGNISMLMLVAGFAPGGAATPAPGAMGVLIVA